MTHKHGSMLSLVMIVSALASGPVTAGIFEACFPRANGVSSHVDTCAKAGTSGTCTGECYEYRRQGCGDCGNDWYYCSSSQVPNGCVYTRYGGQCVAPDCGCVIGQTPGGTVSIDTCAQDDGK